MKKYRTVSCVIIMAIAAIAGFFIGSTLDEAMGGAILFSMIAGIACIVYNIKAINDGKAKVSNVQITDAVPSYTKLGSTPAPQLDPTSAGTVTNNSGTLESTKFDLESGSSVIMKFSVAVDK